MEDESHFLYHLIQSLQLVAAEYSVQISALPDFVVKTDEIALTYYDCFLLADQILEANLITKKQYESLSEINRRMSLMSKKKKYWTLKSLKHDPEWEELRSLAKDVLKGLGIPQDIPILDWIFFVKGK
jgi:hypothetical protein